MKCLCNFLGRHVFSEPLQCVFALILHVSLVWWEMMVIRVFFFLVLSKQQLTKQSKHQVPLVPVQSSSNLFKLM